MKSLCVYCGSSLGRSPDFLEAAQALGAELLRREIRLVYGGASVGIMGAIADTVLAGGGEVVGIIPESLADKEISHHGLTELLVVDSMHTRKAKMAEYSDGFVALAGGFGTLEELFETLTWAQLGFHQKPVGLLNVNGYYDHLLAFLQQAVDQQYLKDQHRNLLLSSEQPEQLLQKMLSFQPIAGDKWLGAGDI